MEKRFDGYLLVSDMDGTLLDDNGKISKENIDAIESFVARGGSFTLATGRMLESVRRYVGKLPVGFPVVLYNGSKIYDFKNEKVIKEYWLNNEPKEIIKNIKEKYGNLGIEIYCEENVFIFNPCRFTERFSKKGYSVFYDIEEALWDKKWTKILILGEADELDILESTFCDNFGQVNLIRSGDNYLEIVPMGTSKGHALQELCEDLSVDISKVITVGDNMNDLELLTSVALGFCVENGNEKLIKVAKYRTKSNNDHAIAHVIKCIEEGSF